MLVGAGAGIGAGDGDGGDGVDFGTLVGLAVSFLGSPLAIFLGFASRCSWGARSVLMRWGSVPLHGGCLGGFRLFSDHFWHG